MAEYCSEDDLVLIRPDVMDLGIKDWSSQIEEAGLVIDRIVEVEWYRRIAEENDIDWRVTPFDRDLLLNADDQLTRLGCYKTLELIFMYLMKHNLEDVYDKERLLFRGLYAEELEDVMKFGLDYDWDESGAITSDESIVPRVRRLVRV